MFAEKIFGDGVPHCSDPECGGVVKPGWWALSCVTAQLLGAGVG